MPGRLDHDLRAFAVARNSAEEGCELAPLRPAADELRPTARVDDAGAQHQPDRPGAHDRDSIPRPDLRALDATEAARERLDHRRHLGRQPRRDGEEIDARDPLGHEQELGVGAVQQRGRLGAVVARRRVRRDDASAGCDVDPAELVPEGARERAEQQWVPAPVGLQVGAVRERDLDLDENVAGTRLGARNFLEPQVAGAVEAQRSHGVKTTFSARPLR